MEDLSSFKLTTFRSKKISKSSVSVILHPVYTGKVLKDKKGMNFDDVASAISDAKIPVVVRVARQGTKKYFQTGCSVSINDWEEVCKAEVTPRSKKFREERELYNKWLDKVSDEVQSIEECGIFSFDKLYEKIYPKQDNKNINNINKVWAELVQTKRDEGKEKTAQSYDGALRRFTADNGAKVSFGAVSNEFIKLWRKKMIDKGMSVTTASIYLRTFRIVVNICIDRGLIAGTTKDLFKGTEYNGCQDRTGQFLSPDDMQKLYDFWKAGEAKGSDGKELFVPNEKDAVFKYLGLFLFSYLCGGQNIADTLNLRYNNHYFSSNGTEMLFFRHKTKDKTNGKSIVIFPIDIEPVHNILAKYANAPKLDRLVFPFMKDGASKAQETDCIKRYNLYIRKALHKVALLCGLDCTPSPTWARHSFATNLANSGVPVKYIKMSMGHAKGEDVINNYLGRAPHSKMMEYNSHLLPMLKCDDRRAKLQAAGFTNEQITAILGIV